MIGQTAMKTIIPKATSSDKYPVVPVSISITEETRSANKHRVRSFHVHVNNRQRFESSRLIAKVTLAVTLADGDEEADLPAAHSP